MEERHVHTVEVMGSRPVSPTESEQPLGRPARRDGSERPAGPHDQHPSWARRDMASAAHPAVNTRKPRASAHRLLPGPVGGKLTWLVGTMAGSDVLSPVVAVVIGAALELLDGATVLDDEDDDVELVAAVVDVVDDVVVVVVVVVGGGTGLVLHAPAGGRTTGWRTVLVIEPDSTSKICAPVGVVSKKTMGVAGAVPATVPCVDVVPVNRYWPVPFTEPLLVKFAPAVIAAADCV